MLGFCLGVSSLKSKPTSLINWRREVLWSNFYTYKMLKHSIPEHYIIQNSGQNTLHTPLFKILFFLIWSSIFFFTIAFFSGQIKKIIKPNLFTKNKIKRQIIKVEKTP